MSILYRDNGYGMKVEAPHRITYSSTENYYTVYGWCMENCKGRFYTGPRWAGQFIDFEDDEDAAWFALRWS